MVCVSTPQRYHRSHFRSRSVLAKVLVLWRFTVSGSIESYGDSFYGTVTFSKGTLIVSDRQSIYNLDANTGVLRWKTDFKTRIGVAPVTDGNAVIVVKDDSSMYPNSRITALNLETGVSIWDIDIPFVPWVTPSLSSGLAYISGGVYEDYSRNSAMPNGIIAAYRLSDGVALWNRPVAGGIRSPLSPTTDRLMFITNLGTLSYLGQQGQSLLPTDLQRILSMTTSPVSTRKIDNALAGISIITLPDPGQILTYSTNRGVYGIWELESGRFLRLGQIGEEISSASVSPDGFHFIVVAGDRLKTWDLRNGTLLESVPITPQTKVFSDGKYQIQLVDNLMALKDIVSGGAYIVKFEGPVGAFRISPDGTQIAVGGDREVQLWDIQTGQKLRSLLSNSSPSAIEFNAAGDILIAQLGGESVQRWSLKDGRPLAPQRDEQGRVDFLGVDRTADLLFTSQNYRDNPFVRLIQKRKLSDGTLLKGSCSISRGEIRFRP